MLEKEKNDQIGRAAAALLFMRISEALSVILLLFDLSSEGRGDRQGAEGRGPDEGGGRPSRGKGTLRGSDHEKTGRQRCLAKKKKKKKKADEEKRRWTEESLWKIKQ